MNQDTQLRQILAVGIVTQTGAYFFLASGVPLFGSSSAIATPPTEQTAAAAAAAANIKFLLPFLLSSFSFSYLTIFSPSTDWTALTTSLLGVAMVDRLVTAGQPRIEAVMVIDAIFTM
jgi:hypothetical protein